MNQTQQVSQEPPMPAPLQPTQQPAVQAEPVEKKSSWFKWLMILLAILIIGGALYYWLFGFGLPPTAS